MKGGEVHVVDYGAGNIGSVINMIKRAGGEALAAREVEILSAATKILLPGVGSFDNAMEKLQALGLIGVLRERAAAGVPILGICLGMQLLATGSEEGVLPGLNLIPGRVRKFDLNAMAPGLKVPHMGWNQTRRTKNSPITEGLDDTSRFYFVHSYHYECAEASDRLLETHHGYHFTSGIERANVSGVQFHPEKSHRYGMQLMKNFLEI